MELTQPPLRADSPEVDVAIAQYNKAKLQQPLPVIAGIYFIQCDVGDKLVKIGIAANVRGRFSSIQCGCPVDLKIISVHPGGREEEKGLHKTFKRFRVRGEWFRPARPLMKYIESIPSIWKTE